MITGIHWPEANDKTWEVVYHLMRTGVTDPAAIEGVVQPNIDTDASTGANVPMEIQISISLPNNRTDGCFSARQQGLEQIRMKRKHASVD